MITFQYDYVVHTYVPEISALKYAWLLASALLFILYIVFCPKLK